MMNTDKMKKISVAALLSLTTMTSVIAPVVLAEQHAHHHSKDIDVASIKAKIAKADKEAESLYKEMDSIQAQVDSIKAAKMGDADKRIPQEVEDLGKQNEAVLSKFYQAVGDKSWSSNQEVKDLVKQSAFSATDKKTLLTYFETVEILEAKLNQTYDAFEQATMTQNDQLRQLTAKIDAIYEKHGVTKDTLAAYYNTMEITAD
ncbi:hypothetical protein DIX60_00815 [Streptococcus iniae]|uniref:Chromosome assembly protein n=2 Tax=Streptococcus iniae TaxID=1346 RepID=A0A1S1XRL4_STRIN|nr:hypothetical protein [Streptococcus iniae]AJG25246.1 hypothetical protein SI82_01105 [Streptococcus iniae]ATX38969.1 hypothetical protein CTW00_00768 [Streptococcus iniae]EKB52334.1 hypothetical protein A0G_0169 [Streptococcus iniae 9117]ELY5748185.1 hypothetical protein [Streptococcus iniae]ELY5750241.1 hypothetical protein [Streptococcus iniae]